MARKAQSLFGTPAPRSESAPTTNLQAYPAFERPLEEKYLQCVLTNTLSNTFYATKQELLQESLSLHDAMLAKDEEFMAKAIVYARNKGFMRTQPILGLAKLATIQKKEEPPSKWFERAFDEVIRTPNDLSDFLSILTSIRKGEGGRRVKRAGGNWLVKNLSEYWTVKYGAEKDSGSYSLRDMVQVFHPKFGKKLPLIDYIMSRAEGRFVRREGTGKDAKYIFENVDIGSLPQVTAFEALKSAKTEDDKVKFITEGKLPHEVATPFAGNSKKVWNAIVPNLPIFALLRNLATLQRHGVLNENRKLIEDKFSDKDTIAKSKILPFRFIEARKHVDSGWAQDCLREGLELSFSNVPDIEGRTAICLDRSGSMGGFINTAATFAICLMKKAKNDGRFMLFDNELEEIHVSMKDSILTQAEKIFARGGTDHSIAIQKLIDDHEKVDNIIYITDEQQNMGSPLVDLIDKYRRKVNKGAKLFIIDVSPYSNSGALMPNTDPNTWFIYGWSDQALSFISMASQGWKGITDFVRLNTLVQDTKS